MKENDSDSNDYESEIYNKNNNYNNNFENSSNENEEENEFIINTNKKKNTNNTTKNMEPAKKVLAQTKNSKSKFKRFMAGLANAIIKLNENMEKRNNIR